MHIAIIAPSDRSYIINFLPEHQLVDLPLGFYGAPFIGILIKELLKQQHRITAVTTSIAVNNNYTVQEFRSGNFTWIVVPSRPHSIRMNGRKIGRIVDLYAYEKRIMTKCIRETNPDFVHAHWSYEFAEAALKSGIPSLITIHDNAIEVLKFNKSLFWFLRFVMSEFTLAKVRFASTVSPYIFKYAQQKCLKVDVIPNPVLIKNTYTQIIELIKNKIQSITSPRFIMINNGWDSRKNGVSGLIAFKALQQKFPLASLHLFGNGSESGGLANQDALKLEILNVNFYGVLSHNLLLLEISKSHILLHPALEESFGVVLIEAMVFGVPVIGGVHSGAVPWVINDDQLLVDISNPKEIENKAMQLLEDEYFYKKKSLQGFENVCSRFDSNYVAKLYIKYYENIIREWV